MAFPSPRKVAIGGALIALGTLAAWAVLRPGQDGWDADRNAQSRAGTSRIEPASDQLGAGTHESGSALSGDGDLASAELEADASGPAGISRSVVSSSTSIRPDITPDIIDRLNRFDENIEEFDAYEAQRAETSTILRGLTVHRLHEALRPGRFSVDTYVESVLKPRYAMSASAVSEVRDILKPLCDELVAERHRAWEAAGVKEGGRFSYTQRTARDLAARKAWLDLDARYAAKIRDADARLRTLLDVMDGVITR